MNFKQSKPNIMMKSFGLGIMSIEFIPKPKNTDGTEETEAFDSENFRQKIAQSGLGYDAQDMFLDPYKPTRLFLLLEEGFEPSTYEKRQTSKEDIQSMRSVAVLSPRFMNRLIILLEKFEELKD